MIFFYLLIICMLFKVNACPTLEYGYSAAEQKSWDKTYHDCGGVRQSPIEINTAKATPVALPAIELVDYHNMLPDPLTLENNGHSVSLSLNSSKAAKSFGPYIFGAFFKDQYKFTEMHFHWGAKNDRGSEHILNSVKYPLEMHLVHCNKNYRTTDEALKHKDGLVVLSVLFELREKEYKPLNVIINKFKSIIHNGCTSKIESFELISLMPSDTDLFYIYAGSLTTPPCSEVVSWIIFPDPILISSKQLNEFHMLKNAKKAPLSDNFRLSQPIKTRKVYKRDPHKNANDYEENIKTLQNTCFC